MLPDIWPGFRRTQGSERTDLQIEFTSYDPSWPARFERWRACLSDALGGIAVSIEHVGSTSVPGLGFCLSTGGRGQGSTLR